MPRETEYAPRAICSWASFTGRAIGPTARHTRPAIPLCISAIWPARPDAASPARSPRAVISSGRICAFHAGGDVVVGLGQSFHALLYLRGRHPRVGQAQARVGPFEHEIGAFDELHVALRRRREQG